MEISGRCESCNVNVLRASMQKHLGSKKHLQNMGQNDIIIPDHSFQKWGLFDKISDSTFKVFRKNSS